MVKTKKRKLDLKNEVCNIYLQLFVTYVNTIVIALQDELHHCPYHDQQNLINYENEDSHVHEDESSEQENTDNLRDENNLRDQHLHCPFHNPQEEEEEEYEDEEQEVQGEEQIEEGDDHEDSYFDILEQLSQLWLSIQLSHKVSMKAADQFWAVGLHWFKKLFDAKNNQKIRFKTPQFVAQRRKLYKKQCPKVHLSFSYKNKTTGDVKIIEDVAVTPQKDFDRNPNFEKLFESASVKVCFN